MGGIMNNLDFSTLKETADFLEVHNDKELLESMETVYDEGEYFVAFIGQFSSGKSYLINNILQRDILPQGALETTPLLTYVRYGRTEEAQVHFLDGSMKTISLADAAGIIQKGNSNVWDLTKLDHIEILVDSPLLSTGLILLDTPGVNTLIERHEQLLAQSMLLASRIVYVTGNAPSRVDVDKMSYMQEHGFDLAYVRSHCDNINTTEESLAEVISGDVETLSKAGIAPSSIFHISNIEGTETYSNIDNLRQLLKDIGSDVNCYRQQDFAKQLEFFRDKYIKQLNEYLTQLEIRQKDELELLKQQQHAAEIKLIGIKDSYESKKDKIRQKTQDELNELRQGFNNNLELFVHQAEQEILNTKDIPNQDYLQELLLRLQQKVLGQSLSYVNNNISPLLSSINGETEFDISSVTKLDLPQFESYEELLANHQDELENIKSKLSNIRDNRDELQNEIELAKDSPEYQELICSLQELQADLQLLKDQQAELGPYVPQMDLVKPDGMQPSDIGKTLGNLADWALMFVPGLGSEAIASKGGKVVSTMAKVIGTAEKATTIIKNGKGIVDVSKKLSKMGKVYKTARRVEQAQKMLKAGKAVYDHVKQNDTTGMLDYMTLEHWGQKLGSCFDTPPRYEENQEYRAAYETEHRRLIEQQLAIQKKSYDRNCQLGLFRTELEKQQAKMESLKVDEKKVCEELARKEKTLRETAIKEAQKKWRKKSAKLFHDTILKQIPPIVEQYLANVPQLLEEYLDKKMFSQKRLIQQEQAKLEDILKMEPKDLNKLLEQGNALVTRLK